MSDTPGNLPEDDAEALERALDGAARPPTEEIASLVALARMLEALPEPEIDPAFAASLEARLMAEAPAAVAPAPARTGVVVRLSARRRVRRTLAAAIAAVLLIGIPTAASANVAPDSSLYGLRLAREEARLWASCRAGSVACGFAHLDRANQRLADLDYVIARRMARYVAPTTKRLRRDLSAGAIKVIDAKPPTPTLQRLARRLDRASAALERMTAAAPLEVRGVLREAIASEEALQRQVSIALGLAPEIPQPPVDAAPPEPPKQPETAAEPEPQQQDQPRQRRPRKDTSGPGGTPRLDRPSSDEEWRSDTPLADSCPLAVVAAPGVQQVCDATKGSG